MWVYFLFTYVLYYNLIFRLFMLSCQVVTPVPNIEYKENKRKTKSWKDINFFSSELKVPGESDRQLLCLNENCNNLRS